MSPLTQGAQNRRIHRNRKKRDFPGRSGVKTLCFYCGQQRSDPQGTKTPHTMRRGQKNKRKQKVECGFQGPEGRGNGVFLSSLFWGVFSYACLLHKITRVKCMYGNKQGAIWYAGEGVEVSAQDGTLRRGSWCVQSFVYLLLVCVAFRPAPETITPAGSAAGQKQSKGRLCARCRPRLLHSWHLLLVRSGKVKGQGGSCPKLKDGLRGLAD